MKVLSAVRPFLFLVFTLPFTVPQAVHVTTASIIEEVATGLEAPWALAFVSDGTIYLTERAGRVRVIRNGSLLPDPEATISVTTFSGGEAGLLGLVVDPDFESNRFLYTYYTYTNSSGQTMNRISRLTEVNGQLVSEQILLDGIRGASIHDGGRLKIGPDGKLYATTGDANNGQLAQNLSSLNGKILRINLDGSIPSDNPFPGSPVYSYGHRNPQGLAWDGAGHLVASEHGPSGTPCCNDEINFIQPGQNYGWPIVFGIAGNPTYHDPLLSTGSDTWAPSGMAFYSSSSIPEWTGKFLVATLRGQHLRMLDISFEGTPHVVSSTAFLSGTYGRLRDAVQGPDGSLYVATGNMDGRGTPPREDKILRISNIPAESPGPVQPLLLAIPILAAILVAALVTAFVVRRRRSLRKRLLSSVSAHTLRTLESRPVILFL